VHIEKVNTVADGKILRMDVDRGGSSLLTIKWGTNFWGDWVNEGDTLQFLGRWQDGKLSWAISGEDKYDLYLLNIKRNTGTFSRMGTAKGTLAVNCRVSSSEYEPAREGTP
jgi:hypothetical protein